ncbi:MAG: hypothetical protein F4X35_13200 [Alphaproteobacteria bacterium]|nr:hypothetical protein [Alphaproteobacteria bacterium]
MNKEGYDLDVWVRMYEEQIRHVRHHEALRSSSTNFVVVISAAALGLFAADMISEWRWLLALFVVFINVYGLLMGLKHYERSRLHHAVADRYRAVISETCKAGSHEINELRSAAQREHFGHSRLPRWLRVYLLWCGLHILLAVLGILLLILLSR